MNFQLVAILFFLVGFVLILAFCEFLYAKDILQAEYTRKIGHILSCLASLLFIYIFNSHWYILVLCILLFGLLYIGKQKGAFKSIESVNRVTEGSYLLPISVYLLFLLFDITVNKLYFILPLLILGISDPLAGFSGMHFEKRTTNIRIMGIQYRKTILGSVTFFLSTLTISIITLFYFDFSVQHILIWGIIISLTTTILEIVSSKGFDNLSIPILTSSLIWLSLF